VVALNETWTDYDGDAAYADYTVDGSTLIQTAIYEPGLGRSSDPTNPLATQYYHADQIGTTRLMTDTPGAGISPTAVSESSFTAFGEQIGGTAQRYGYAGTWGYETDNSADGFPFLHVGARYYDPATGRFLQRDPMGIDGGINVYEYVSSSPVTLVDPEGAYPHGALGMMHRYRGYRMQGKSRSEAVEAMRRDAKSEAQIAIVSLPAVACVVLAYEGAAALIARYGPSLLVRLRLRLGPTVSPKGPPVSPTPIVRPVPMRPPPMIRPPRWVPAPPPGSWHPPLNLN